MAISKSGTSALRRGMWLALGLAIGTTAHAATVIGTYDGFDPNNPVEVNRTLKNPYLVGPGYDTRRVDPGRFTLTRTGGDYTGDLVGTTPQFYAFCLEPLEFINTGGSYTYTFDALENGATNIGGIGVTKADYIRELFYQQLPDFSATITNEKASALNVAVWEIVRENPSNAFNVLSGDASFSSFNTAGTNMLTLAQSYLSGLTGSGPRLDNLYALTKVGAQDLLVQTQSAPVPEPAAVVSLLSGGVIGLLALRRHRHRGQEQPAR